MIEFQFDNFGLGGVIMLKLNLQLFAHKKGMGSTKNGSRIQETWSEESRRTVC